MHNIFRFKYLLVQNNIEEMNVRQFEIPLQNKPGELSNICNILADAGINIEAVATELKDENFGMVKIITNDAQRTRKILKTAGIDYSEYEIVTVRLDDRPGELAKLSTIFAKSEINIESLYVLDKHDGKTVLAIKVNNIAAAKNILEKNAI